MKTTCIIICLLLFILATSFHMFTLLNWTFSQPISTGAILSISFPSNNFSAYSLLNPASSRNESKGAVLPPSLNRRFAIFTCSIHSTTLAYTFYTPITAAAWQRVGYNVIVVFVGDFTKPHVLTPRLILSRNYLKYIGAYIVDVQSEEWYSVKISQVLRVFSGFLPDSIVEDDDNILTTDSDLIPIKASEYQPTADTNGFIFNAFCCGKFKRHGRTYPMYPMSHIFMQKKAWRAIVMESKERTKILAANTDKRTEDLLSADAVMSIDMIALYTREEFKHVFDQNMDKGDSGWYMDQVLCSMFLTDYLERHSNFTLMQRGILPRLDRDKGLSFWDRNNFSEFGDAHLIHDEILLEGNWKIFNNFLKALFDDSFVAVFNDYHEQYMDIDKMPTK